MFAAMLECYSHCNDSLWRPSSPATGAPTGLLAALAADTGRSSSTSRMPPAMMGLSAQLQDQSQNIMNLASDAVSVVFPLLMVVNYHCRDCCCHLGPHLNLQAC
jgi:hypothetical protein